MTSAIDELAELLAHVWNRLEKISIDNADADRLVRIAKLHVIQASEDLRTARCHLIPKETTSDSTSRHQDP